MPSQTEPSTSRHHFDLIPGELSARVHMHSVQSTSGPIPCWTYVTDGLRAHGQKELIFTLRREPGDDTHDIPKAPLKLFAQIYRLAESGRLVDVGGFTQFGASGFMGCQGLAYIAPQRFDGIEITGPSLAAIMLSGDELDAARQFGITRVMSRLGKAHSYFPCPPWSDPTRPGLRFADMNEESILARCARAKLTGATVSAEGKQIVLRLLPTAGEELEALLAKAPPNAALAVLPELDPSADACLVWEPGQSEPSAIAMPNGGGTRIAGCFVAFAPGQATNGAQVVEDGFIVMMTDAAWTDFRSSLKTRKPAALAASNGAYGFALAWIEDTYVSPVDGSVYRAQEGWRARQPSGGVEANEAAVEVNRAMLLTAEAEIAARVDVEDLGNYMRAINVTVMAYFAAIPPAAGQDLVLQFDLAPEGTLELKIASRPGVGKELTQGLYERVTALERPKVSGGPVSFQSILTVWGGSGQAI